MLVSVLRGNTYTFPYTWTKESYGKSKFTVNRLGLTLIRSVTCKLHLRFLSFVCSYVLTVCTELNYFIGTKKREALEIEEEEES